MNDGRAAALADELVAAREGFLRAIATRPEAAPVSGEWGMRELVAHLGYWAGQATEAIHRVESGDAGSFDLDAPGTEERNATVARVARQSSMASVRAREAAAAQALVDRLRAVADQALLDRALPNGRTLGDEVRVHGPDHYRGHAEEVR